jgi:hypothetical protein
MTELLRDVLRQAPVMDVASWSAQRKQVALSFKDADKTSLVPVFMAGQVLVVELDSVLLALSHEVFLNRACPRLARPVRVRVDLGCGLADLMLSVKGDDYQSTLYFDREPRVDKFGGSHRGGVWWGDERRRDALGRWWQRSFRDLVTDDFGCLVSSQTGLAP